jgi:hypothetical protein
MPDFIVASTTATQKEIDHAVSSDWRTPIAVEEKPAEPEAVVEPEVPVASEEAETAPESEPEPKQEEDKPVKGKGGFQKKIDKLTREKSEALSAKENLERELAEFKERFERIEKRLAPAETKDEKTETKPQFLTRPQPLESEIGTKYKDWDEYLSDLVDWKTDEKLAARDKTAQSREQQEIQAARDEGYRDSVTEFLKEVPDFNSAVLAATKAGMKLPEPIIEKIKDLPNGPAVTYYLVTNPDEALALVEMDPVEGFIALGRISHGLESQPKTEPPKPPAKKAVSTAPVAVKPVAGNSAKSGNSLQDISQRSTDDYVRARMQQMKERDARRY